MILYVNSDAKTRKSKFLTNFWTWNFRIWSWNLLLKLKHCLQRLQIVRTSTIREIDAFFVDFDAKLSTRNWKFEYFDETNCKSVSVSDVRFFDVVKINDSSEKNEQMSIDFFSNSHNDLNVKIVKNEFLTNFKVLCSLMCSKNFLLKSKFCSHCLHFARMRAIFWIDEFFIVFDIVTNVFNEKSKRNVFNLANK